MRDDLFIHLEDKFASFSKLASPEEARLLERTMAEAGRLLFDALTKNWTTLKTLAPWLTQRPEQRRFTEDRQDRIVEVLEPQWAMYWWYAIVWLQRERADTGIVLPAGRLGRFESSPRWYDFGTGPFIDALHPNFKWKAEMDLWKQVASASADACTFLTCLLAAHSAEVFMTAKYFEKFGIPDDRLRKAKQLGKVGVQEGPDARNRYSVQDVKALWPEDFEERSAGRS